MCLCEGWWLTANCFANIFLSSSLRCRSSASLASTSGFISALIKASKGSTPSSWNGDPTSKLSSQAVNTEMDGFSFYKSKGKLQVYSAEDSPAQQEVLQLSSNEAVALYSWQQLL